MRKSWCLENSLLINNSGPGTESAWNVIEPPSPVAGGWLWPEWPEKQLYQVWQQDHPFIRQSLNAIEIHISSWAIWLRSAGHIRSVLQHIKSWTMSTGQSILPVIASQPWQVTMAYLPLTVFYGVYLIPADTETGFFQFRDFRLESLVRKWSLIIRYHLVLVE